MKMNDYLIFSKENQATMRKEYLITFSIEKIT